MVLLVPLFYFFSPMIFQGQRPAGVDISASKGSTNLVQAYNAEGEARALWNPNIFAGMPIYPRITPQVIHIDSIVELFSKVIYMYFWYFLIGALGVFFLLKYKKIPWYIALIPALAYMLLPHWMALLHVGHFAKLRAFMIIPWSILSFNYLFDRRSWLSAGLFALVFSWMVRTQHMQVTFYAILVLLFLFLVPAVKMVFKKEWKDFGQFVLKLAVALVLTVAVSSQPFVSLQEYASHSTRGGNAVQMNESVKNQDETKGVGLEYATRWSLDGKGVVGFFLPRFAGGLSRETYQGNQYPQLKGRAIPGYWGGMPFTQSYDFVGVLIAIFAGLGIWAYWKKDGFVRGLSIFSGFAVLLGLGRHFMPLYKLFFNIIPYFNKFRVPSMIMNMIFLALIILAGYGIKAVIEEAKKANWKMIVSVFGGVAGILLLMLLFSGGFAYEKAGEAARYGAQAMEVYRNIRKEYLQTDIWKALVLVLTTGGVLTAFAFKKIKPVLTYVLLGMLVAIELFSISNLAYKNIPLGNPKSLERREFRQSDITRYLVSQSKDSRALALGNDSNHYSYFYPTISGYSAIKLQTIQDLREHCLYTENGINWNIVNMLGGKYLIAPGRLQESFLKIAATDVNRKEILYINENANPKAWLVQNIKLFETPADMLRYMNIKTFNAASEALLIDNGKNQPTTYSAKGSVILKENTPNKLSFKVELNEPQFVVFSEMYYPEGWSLKKEGKKIEILKTNHALRGAQLPAGKYTLDMEFHPSSYYAGRGIVWIGDVIMLILIGGSVLLANRDKIFKRKEK